MGAGLEGGVSGVTFGGAASVGAPVEEALVVGRAGVDAEAGVADGAGLVLPRRRLVGIALDALRGRCNPKFACPAQFLSPLLQPWFRQKLAQVMESAKLLSFPPHPLNLKLAVLPKKKER